MTKRHEQNPPQKNTSSQLADGTPRQEPREAPHAAAPRTDWKNTLAALLIGLFVGSAVSLLTVYLPMSNKIAVLEDNLSDLQTGHDKELREFKCGLYDQALEKFSRDCDARGALVGTQCNYDDGEGKERGERFFPPLQGLERLCGVQD